MRFLYLSMVSEFEQQARASIPNINWKAKQGSTEYPEMRKLFSDINRTRQNE